MTREKHSHPKKKRHKPVPELPELPIFCAKYENCECSIYLPGFRCFHLSKQGLPIDQFILSRVFICEEQPYKGFVRLSVHPSVCLSVHPTMGHTFLKNRQFNKIQQNLRLFATISRVTDSFLVTYL